MLLSQKYFKYILLSIASIILVGFTYYLPIVHRTVPDITIIDDTTRRITFSNQQTVIEQDGLSLLPGMSVEYLIADDGGERFVFKIDLDRDISLQSELFNSNGDPLSKGQNPVRDWNTSRTAPGDYRVILTNNNENTTFYGLKVTRTLLSERQKLFSDLVAKFTAANINVRHLPSTQRDTVFDQLYDTDLSDREILYLNDPQHRVDVYLFDNEQQATEIADIIEPGASQLVRREGGLIDIIPLRIETGSIPLWWLEGPALVYTTGPKIDLEEKVIAALGAPLGSDSADVFKIRLNNRTEHMLSKVQIRSVESDTEIVLEDVLVGISGYQTLMAEEGLLISTTYQSQILTNTIAPLSPGDYSLDIAVNDTQLMLRIFDDRHYYTATDLIDQNWLWLHTDLADGTQFLPVSADIQPSYLRFYTRTTGNLGEAGQIYGGNMGCNGMGGLYFTNANQQLLFVRGSRTLMLCGEEAAMDSEDFWAVNAEFVHHYTIEDDLLHLFATNGNTFIFEREEEVSTEDRIARNIISGWGGGTPVLVVSESVAGRSSATPDDIRAKVNELFSDLSGVSIENFLAVNSTPIDFNDLITADEDVILITPAELEQLFANGRAAGWASIDEQYGAKAIFTFSQLGLNEAGDQALLYYSRQGPTTYVGYYSLRSRSGDNWVEGRSILAWDSDD